MDDFFLFFFALIIIAIVVLLAQVPSEEYIERIEEKYNIHVVENEATVVVYNNGKCVATKRPYDELERVGCGEFSEKLSD